MSRAHTCYNCGGRTERYDDAFCADCQARRAKEEAETVAVLLKKLGFGRQALRMTIGRTPPAKTEMFGPMVDGLTVGEWCPTPDGSGKPEAVALVFNVREFGDLVMRLKSRRACNEIIDALTAHRDAVFPEKS